VTKLCTLLSSEDQVSHDRFEVRRELSEADDIADPYVAASFARRARRRRDV
jgi:hypothetical protein